MMGPLATGGISIMRFRFAQTIAPALLAAALADPAHAQTILLSESFDTFPLCGTGCGNACLLPMASGWLNETFDQRDWTVHSGGTPSGSTGPSADHTRGDSSGRYLYTEASGACANDTMEVLSPVINLVGSTAPTVSFWYHMSGGSMGQLHVDVINDPVATGIRTNDVIAPLNDNLDQWQQLRCIQLDPAAGSAQVVFRGVTGNGLHSDMAIDDVVVREAVPDLELRALRVVGECAGPAEIIVDVSNNDLNPAAGASIEYTVNGGAPVTEALAAPVPGCTNTTHRFTTQANLQAGTATITARVVYAADVVAANDSLSTLKVTRPLIGAFPYAEDFEAGPGGWGTTGTPLWSLGTPADQVISAAQSGSQAWVTGLDANYPDNAQAYLESACFDGTTLSNPRFEAFIFYETEFSWDGAQIQTSTDSINWRTVGGLSPNWYNDGSIAGLAPTGSVVGFTGRTNTGNGSNGWRFISQDLGNGTAGSTFQVRVVFGADRSVNDEGVAIDTVTVFDNPPRLTITDRTVPNLSTFAAGASDVFVAALQVQNFVATNSLDAISIELSGTIGDAGVAAARLWLDDGDGVPEPGTGDTLLAAPGTFLNGITNFSLSPALPLAADETQTLFVTYDLGQGVGGGLTFGAGIGSPGLVTVSNTHPVVFPEGPPQAPLSSTFAAIDILPFADNFDGAAVGNRRLAPRQGVFPQASAAGTLVGTSALTASDATLTTIDTVGGVIANSAPYMAAIAYLNGPATGAIDYVFDLSSYDVNSDEVFVEVWWDNVAQTDDPEDNIFVSLDGGVTWTGSLYNFDFTSPVASGWNRTQANLSALLRSANLGFTNNVAVRLQAAGDVTSALLFDDLWFGIPEALRVERLPGAPLLSGAVDQLGSIIGGLPFDVTYTLHNDGQRDLVVSASPAGVANAMNVSLVGTSSAVTIAPGANATWTATLFVPAPGPFSLDLTIESNDPRLPAGFALTLGGTARFEPDIELALSNGTALLSGSSQSLGRVRVGSLATSDYILSNRGGGALTLTGTPTIDLVNTLNLGSVMISSVPRQISPMGAEAFSVAFSPTARGPFAAELTITSDDPDEGVYVVTATGTAVEPDINVQYAGADVPSGGTEDLGLSAVGVAQSLAFGLQNLGNEDLLLTGQPRVALMDFTQAVTATVSMMPTSTVSARVDSGFTLDVTPTAPGAFGFNLVIGSDDPDEAAYTISITGLGYVPAPEISISRGGAELANGATEDVGQSLPGVQQTLTYTITNPGTLDLELSSPVEIRNPSNVEASIDTQPSTTLTPGASERFEVAFGPAAEGSFAFDIVVLSNDADEGTYTISVRGAGDSQAPEIEIAQPPGTDRADGETIELGEVDVGAAQSLTFSVTNTGAGPLSLTADPRVALTSLVNATATVDAQPDSPVAAAAGTTFTVSVIAAAAGAFSANVVVENDDGNEGNFTLTLSGTGRTESGPGPGEGEDGCGCTAARMHPNSAPWGALALILLAFVRRRRR